MFKLFSKFSPARLLSIAAMGLALHAAPAAADTFNVGTVPAATPLVKVVSHYGSFMDFFAFNLSGESNVSASLTSLDLDLGHYSILNIDNLYMGLFSLSDPMTVLAHGTSSLSYNGLDAGNYFIRVAGDANGLFGGRYLGGLVAMPVPEPEQWMLFAAGLMAVGSIVRRRA